MTTSTTTTTTDPLADITTVDRHPIRGLLWGMLMGVGLTVVLVVTKVIDLELSMMVVVTAAAVVVGVVWGLAGPAKPAKGPLPAHLRRAPEPPPASRFDDFDDTAEPNDASSAETVADAASGDDD